MDEEETYMDDDEVEICDNDDDDDDDDEDEDDDDDDDEEEEEENTAELEQFVPILLSIIHTVNSDGVAPVHVFKELYSQAPTARATLKAHGRTAKSFCDLYPKRLLFCVVAVDGAKIQDCVVDVQKATMKLAGLFKSTVRGNTKMKSTYVVNQCRERCPYFKDLLVHLDLKWIEFVNAHVPTLVFSGEGTRTHDFLSANVTMKWRHVDGFLLFLFRKYKRREWPATRNELNVERTSFKELYPEKAVPSSSELLFYLRTTANLMKWVGQDGQLKWVHNIKQLCAAKSRSSNNDDANTSSNQNANNNHTSANITTSSTANTAVSPIIPAPLPANNPWQPAPPSPPPHGIPTIVTNNPTTNNHTTTTATNNPTTNNHTTTTTTNNPTTDNPATTTTNEMIQEQVENDYSVGYSYITTAQGLQQVVVDLESLTDVNGEPQVVAFDCEGVPENVNLLQLATSNAVWVIDCDSIGLTHVVAVLQPFLCSPRITKVAHDVHQDAWGLYNLQGVTLDGVVDSQLAYELLFGGLHVGFNAMLKYLECKQTHDTKNMMKRRMQADPKLWSRRPLAPEAIAYAAQDVSLLLCAYTDKLQGILTDQGLDIVVAKASVLRVKHAIRHEGQRSVWFDHENNYRMCSAELWWSMNPQYVTPPGPKVDNSEVEQLFQMLPAHYQPDILADDTQMAMLSDIVLDKQRRPMVFVDGLRKNLCADESVVVTEEDLDDIVTQIGGDDRFGEDNRAGIDGCLHRISAMRNREQHIYGLTMRAGRHVFGIADMIKDILHEYSHQSVLILGAPGSGKTTIIRDIACTLAMTQNVCIVDTSNEIAGDGDVPHACVGHARRMMVPSLASQSRVMVECVQNHTPHVIIIDEIGRESEVSAAQTVKNRGVRIIASAHGDFRKLMKNRQLKNLVGEVANTIKTGGKAARERTSEPIFDIVVEVRRNNNTEWNVILDAGKAVDNVIEGQKIKCM